MLERSGLQLLSGRTAWRTASESKRFVHKININPWKYIYISDAREKRFVKTVGRFRNQRVCDISTYAKQCLKTYPLV